ncbi:hypothetical protein K438DRAFT_2033062 [Mycena galopus ATCC 62051]|nr:hypothetical protein K438DRAFT_2033062 [Mycena galopus ATCC 62051]
MPVASHSSATARGRSVRAATGGKIKNCDERRGGDLAAYGVFSVPLVMLLQAPPPSRAASATDLLPSPSAPCLVPRHFTRLARTRGLMRRKSLRAPFFAGNIPGIAPPRITSPPSTRRYTLQPSLSRTSSHAFPCVRPPTSHERLPVPASPAPRHIASPPPARAYNHNHRLHASGLSALPPVMSAQRIPVLMHTHAQRCLSVSFAGPLGSSSAPHILPSSPPPSVAPPLKGALNAMHFACAPRSRATPCPIAGACAWACRAAFKGVHRRSARIHSSTHPRTRLIGTGARGASLRSCHSGPPSLALAPAYSVSAPQEQEPPPASAAPPSPSPSFSAPRSPSTVPSTPRPRDPTSLVALPRYSPQSVYPPLPLSPHTTSPPPGSHTAQPQRCTFITRNLPWRVLDAQAPRRQPSILGH